MSTFKKILTPILISIIIIFMLSSFLYNQMMKEYLYNSTITTLENNLLLYSKEIEIYFQDSIDLINQMASENLYAEFVNEHSSLDIDSSEYDEIMRLLRNHHSSVDKVSLVWIGLINSKAIITNNDGLFQNENYNIESRPWFKKMLENKETFITSPYIDSITGKKVISIIKPIYYENKIIGNYGVDIDLEYIKSLLQSDFFMDFAEVLLISSDNKLVDIGSRKYKVSDSDISKTELDKIFTAINNNDFGIYDFGSNQKGSFIGYIHLDYLNWKLIGIVDKNTVEKEVNILNYISLSLLGTSILIIIIYTVILKKNTNYNELKKLYNELKEKEKNIYNLAYSDSLTGLRNKRSFDNFLNTQINSNEDCAVLLLDIDNFKLINDSLGHVTGDKILKIVANRLLELDSHFDYVAKYGGDEFLILMNVNISNSNIRTFVETLDSKFNTPIIIDNETVHINLSVGVSHFPKDAQNENDLITFANIAMCDAKKNSTQSVSFFTHDMFKSVINRRIIIDAIRDALLANSFKFVYQPLIDSTTGEVAGYEALLRMSNNTYTPDKFIPIAEQTGQIIDIGRWGIMEAIETLKRFQSNKSRLVPISVNFSVKQLKDKKFIDFISDALITNNIDPSLLEIEITESIFIEDEDEANEFMKSIRSLGLSLSLDDFGTGYSSLNYLMEYNFDKVKLDRSLINKCDNKETIAVIEGIISLSHKINMTVVAEGVETKEQFELFKNMGVDIIQGYYFSKPKDYTEIDNSKIY